MKTENTMINIKNELENWLVDYITDFVHEVKVEGQPNPEFEEWAKSFPREEAEFVVGMEFPNDWGYDKRKEVSEEEAEEYAHELLKTIFDNWYK